MVKYAVQKPAPGWRSVLGTPLFLAMLLLALLPPAGRHMLHTSKAQAPGGGPSAARQPEGERSHYLQWIQQDLSYWRQRGGITQQLVDAAEAQMTCCYFRAQVVGGRLYISHPPPDPKKGFFPAGLGPGWASAKGRIHYAVLALMDTLRHYPDIPDLDIVVSSSDLPRLRRDAARRNGSAAVAPPLFSFNSHDEYVDIPFPDYSFWGHELQILNDDQGRWLWGWDEQREFLSQEWQQPLRQRRPQLVWRGTSEGRRYELRRRFRQCPGSLRQAGNTAGAALFNVLQQQEQNITLRTNCAFRYQAYLEAKAWSTSLKQKLACGSVILTPRMEYHEFWSRALQPGRHYLELEPGQAMCRDAAAKMEAMNAYLDGNSRPSQPEGGEFAWGSSLTPQQIADAGRQFLQGYLRMEDVRLYLRDALIEYAALQRFQPRPQEQSVCFTGRRLLDLFSIPRPAEAAAVARRYPWLESWDPGCTERR